MEGMNASQKTIYGDVFGGTHELALWVDASWEDRADLLDYLLTEDPQAAQTDRSDMLVLDERLHELYRQMDQADTDREDVGTLAALESAWNSYTVWRDETVLGQMERGDRAAALAAYRADGTRLSTQVDAAIDAFLAKKGEVGANLEAQSARSFERTRTIATLLGIGAVGLGLGIGFFFSRSFARGVRQVAHAAEGLAVGDLNQHITLESRDEIGAMAHAVRQMIGYQQEMARVAGAIAAGDLTQNVVPKGASDQLGTAFQHMIRNLRTLVGQLEEAVRGSKRMAELAEEGEARMRAVLDSVADAILTFDAAGQIETVNPTAERMFGAEKGELVGRQMADLLGEHPPDALVFGTHHELAGLRLDGSSFPMDLAVSEMRLGGRRLSIASIRDITERKQADAKFRGLLESAPDAIVTVNGEGRIALVNTQAERLFGYDRSELLGQTIEILMPERLRGAHQLHRPRYLKSPTTRSMGGGLELTARRKDGSEFPAEISLSPLQSEEGILTTSVVRDITERKQAQEAQRFLTQASTLLAASLDYATTLNSVAQLAVPFLADGVIVEVVKEDGEDADAMTAVAMVEPDGLPLGGVLGSLPGQVLRTGQAFVLNGDVAPDDLDAEAALLRRSGFTALIVPLVAGGRTLGVMSFVATGTGRDYGPKGLSLAEELAHRCALAIENARLYREAQRAIGLRDDFFSVASHELKTPVAALLAYTQFMLNRAERRQGLTVEQTLQALEEVHFQSDRIGKLVAQLLDTSRLDAGKLALDPELTALTRLVQLAIRTAKTGDPRHAITVKASGPNWAVVDPVRMEQVIINLVDNAIKYSPDGGPIEVELRQIDDSHICLSVTDHGIGIPPEHRAHVFDRFYQAHAGQHFAGVAGMGLGLYITRRIVEMHGGTIEIEAPAVGGSRVTVTLPADVEANRALASRRQYRVDSAVAEAIGAD
jgi:protein-histidine pros-kinase